MKRHHPMRTSKPLGLHAYRAATPAPDSDFWYQDTPAGGAAGMHVTADTALQAAAVLACVRVLAETLAQIPLILYRRRADGGKDRASDEPLYEVLHDRPNNYQTSFEFREMLMGHLALRGNAYGLRVPGRRGAVDQIIPLHPDRMRPRWSGRPGFSQILYQYTWPGEAGTETFTQEEIFHVRGLSSDGLVGLNPIEYARRPIGMALAAEEYGAQTLQNGAVPGGLLTHPNRLSDQGRANLAKSWAATHSGPHNAGKVAILEEGMDFKTLGMKNTDAQYLESRQFQTTEIARIFRVPPHMIADLTRSTNNNIEHQGIEFVKYTMQPWAVRWEQAIGRDLISDPTEVFAEFLFDGLERGDLQSRYTAYQSGISNGHLSPNEARLRENQNPIEGGDQYFRPQNLAPLNAPPEPVDTTAAAVEPDEDDAQAEDAPEEGMSAAHRGFVPLINDAGSRLASAEVNGLAKRVAKASEDRDRFNAWVAEFYAEHYGYALKTLAPLVEAWLAATGKTVDAQQIAEFVACPVPMQACGDPAALLAGWREHRATDVAAAVFVAFDPDQERDEQGKFSDGGGSSSSTTDRAAEDRERSKARDAEDDAMRDRHMAERQAAEQEVARVEKAANEEREQMEKRHEDEREALAEKLSEEAPMDESDLESHLEDIADKYEPPPDVQAARDAERADLESKGDDMSDEEYSDAEEAMQERWDKEDRAAYRKEQKAAREQWKKDTREHDKRERRETKQLEDKQYDEEQAHEDKWGSQYQEAERRREETEQRHQEEIATVNNRRDAEDRATIKRRQEEDRKGAA